MVEHGCFWHRPSIQTAGQQHLMSRAHVQVISFHRGTISNCHWMFEACRRLNAGRRWARAGVICDATRRDRLCHKPTQSGWTGVFIAAMPKFQPRVGCWVTRPLVNGLGCTSVDPRHGQSESIARMSFERPCRRVPWSRIRRTNPTWATTGRVPRQACNATGSIPRRLSSGGHGRRKAREHPQDM